MKIETGNVRPDVLDVAAKDKAARSARDGARGEGTADQAGARQEVALSARLRQIRELAGEIQDVASVDRTRVAELRAKIDAGVFTPSPEAIAQAMFGELAAEER